MGTPRIAVPCPEPEDLSLLALGALEPDEVAPLQAHVERCPRCRLQYAGLESTVELLPHAAPPLAPPAGMKERVLAAVTSPAPAEPPAAGGLAARFRQGGAAAWLRVGGVAAVLALAVVTGSLALQVSHLKDELAELEQWERFAYDGLGAVNASLNSAARTGLKVVPLEATPAAGGAGGSVILAPTRDGQVKVVVYVWKLPRPANRQVYHVWLVRDGERTSGGTFTTDYQGRGGRMIQVPGVDFQAIGVTLEPDANVMQPRGQRVLAGNL